MLVPHELHADPRVQWVLDLCGTLADTTVIAVTAGEATRAPTSAATVEGVDPFRDSSRFARELRRTARLEGLGRAGRLAADWSFYGLLISALRRAAVACSHPDLILCHDLYALIAGVAAGQRLGSRVLYDAHEFFPQANPRSPAWERRLLTEVERHFIRRADGVVTVSPPLARALERQYGLDHVGVAPNAAPLADAPVPFTQRDSSRVTFLVQGQVAPGRGFHRLLRAWATLDDPRAVLQVRAPQNDYADALRAEFEGLFRSGRAEWLESVAEGALITSAAQADVGVIPYPGPLLNHVFSCPNKLSQYMAAGAAILASRDLVYVRDLVRHHEMGLLYDPSDPGSLKQAVGRFTSEDGFRRRSQANARRTFEQSFNWERCSEEYRAMLQGLVDGSARAPAARPSSRRRYTSPARGQRRASGARSPSFLDDADS
jgi:glycosyltransferase involved in cell wall biosynthesis